MRPSKRHLAVGRYDALRHIDRARESMRLALRDMHAYDPFLPALQFHLFLIDELTDAIERTVRKDFKELREKFERLKLSE